MLLMWAFSNKSTLYESQSEHYRYICIRNILNMKKLLLLLPVCFLLTANEAYPKITPDKLRDAVQSHLGNGHGKVLVTMPLLKSATKISYGFSNGSVAPEYAYAGYISVSPQGVSLDIYHMSELCYSQSISLTSYEYNGFLKDLLALGIKSNDDGFGGLCGALGSDITIMKGTKKIFSGSEDEDITTSRGHLSDPFVKLLDAEMLEIYEDPSATFEDLDVILPDEIPGLDLD